MINLPLENEITPIFQYNNASVNLKQNTIWYFEDFRTSQPFQAVNTNNAPANINSGQYPILNIHKIDTYGILLQKQEVESFRTETNLYNYSTIYSNLGDTQYYYIPYGETLNQNTQEFNAPYFFEDEYPNTSYYENWCRMPGGTIYVSYIRGNKKSDDPYYYMYITKDTPNGEVITYTKKISADRPTKNAQDLGTTLLILYKDTISSCQNHKFVEPKYYQYKYGDTDYKSGELRDPILHPNSLNQQPQDKLVWNDTSCLFFTNDRDIYPLQSSTNMPHYNFNILDMRGKELNLTYPEPNAASSFFAASTCDIMYDKQKHGRTIYFRSTYSSYYLMYIKNVDEQILFEQTSPNPGAAAIDIIATQVRSPQKSDGTAANTVLYSLYTGKSFYSLDQGQTWIQDNTSVYYVG